MNTVCISTKMSIPRKVGENKGPTCPPLQKVGEMSPVHHGSTPTLKIADIITFTTIVSLSCYKAEGNCRPKFNYSGARVITFCVNMMHLNFQFLYLLTYTSTQ